MATPEKIKILIIDDEEETRFFLKRMLERRGYCVFTAGDGEEGLEKIKESDIHIVFSDIMMPKINGIEFLKEVRKHSLAIQVIMVTGKSDLNNCLEAVEYGASGYLIKPVLEEDLIDSILLAERNIAEKKEMVKKAISQIEGEKVNDILKQALKSGQDLDALKEGIKKNSDREKRPN